MANFIRSASFQPFTASASPAPATNYPASNLAITEFPRLPWRSTSGAPQQIFLDFGAPISISAVGVFYTNFAVMTLSHGASVGGSFTNLPGAPFAAGPEPPPNGDFRFGIVSSFTNRVLQISIPSQGTSDAAPYYSIGLVVCMTNVVTFLTNPEPALTWGLRTPSFSQDIGAHKEFVKAGPKVITLEWGGRWLNSESQQMLDMKALIELGPYTPFVLFRNRGLAQETYFFRVLQGRWQEDYPTSSGSISMEEVV